MELKIRNINKIKEANIQLNGLTILVGENDSGKSTIGRVLFSSIKALVNTKANNEREKQLLFKHVQSLYRRLASTGFVRGVRVDDCIKSVFPCNTRDFIHTLEQEKEIIEQYIKTLLSAVDELETSPRMKSLMKSDLNRIKICMAEKDNRAAGVYTEFQYLLESEFLNQFCALNNVDVSIDLIADDKLTSFFRYYTGVKGGSAQCEDEEYLEDVTYVESPLYMHLLDSLMYAGEYREVDKRRRSLFPMIPYHIKDFVAKMNSLSSNFGQPDLFHEDIVDTAEITGGMFSYDSTKKTIVFVKDGLTVMPLNTASGIKSFGVLQLLLDGGFIDNNRPLIWDEPENHLHPEWQVEFAKILVQLYKSGIPIIITTHSPYFIQAIRFFAAKENAENYVTYYMAKPDDNGLVTMEDVTDDLNQVFKKLSTPLSRIMNVDAVRQGIEIK